MKKVTFFDAGMDWDGSEKWLLSAAGFLKHHALEVEFVCAPHSRLGYDASIAGHKVVELKLPSLGFLSPIKRAELSKYLSGSEALILSESKGLKLCALAAQRAGVKKVIYRRNTPVPVQNKAVNKKIYHSLYAIIASSKDTARASALHTESWFPNDKVHVIYNGLDLDRLQRSEERFRKKTEGEIILGTAGALVEHKNQKDLLKVASILKEQGFSFHLLIAGHGQLESDLKALAAKYKLQGLVTFLGHVKDMPKFYNSIDYYTSTSRIEGFPNDLLEAMAYKKLCFAYDASSIPEVLNYTNGYLSPLGDAGDMAYKIQNHLPGNQEANAYRDVQEKFNFQSNMQRLLDILD